VHLLAQNILEEKKVFILDANPALWRPKGAQRLVYRARPSTVVYSATLRLKAASKIWFLTLRTQPGHCAPASWWLSNIGCPWGVFCVLGDFGPFEVSFGVVLGHFEADFC
jgi:hypothetical protein